jgi:hypothetical protein
MQHLPMKTVALGLPADFPPLKTLGAHPNNLPIQPTPFIGREQEVAAVEHLQNTVVFSFHEGGDLCRCLTRS